MAVTGVVEIGQSPTGVATMNAWIASQVASGHTNFLGSGSFKDSEEEYKVSVMSAVLSKYAGQPLGALVLSSEFSVRDSPAALTAWLTAAEIGTVTPTVAPAVTVSGTTGTVATGTYLVYTTLVSALGETLPSPSTSIAVTLGEDIVVAQPAQDAAGTATGWNVYITAVGGAAGTETKQTTSPIAFPASGGAAQTFVLAAPPATGSVPPTTNQTVAKWVVDFTVFERQEAAIASVTVAN